MSDEPSSERDEDADVGMCRVFRHGTLVHQQLVESEEQAALVVDQWAEIEGVRCEVGDLSIRHHPADIVEPELLIRPDEGHDE